MPLPAKAAVLRRLWGILDVTDPLRQAAEMSQGAPWVGASPNLARLRLRAAARRHPDFASVTTDPLDGTPARDGLAGPGLRDRLPDLQGPSPALPRAHVAVEVPRARGPACVVLTNATPHMIGAVSMRQVWRRSSTRS